MTENSPTHSVRREASSTSDRSTACPPRIAATFPESFKGVNIVCLGRVQSETHAVLFANNASLIADEIDEFISWEQNLLNEDVLHSIALKPHLGFDPTFRLDEATRTLTVHVPVSATVDEDDLDRLAELFLEQFADALEDAWTIDIMVGKVHSYCPRLESRTTMPSRLEAAKALRAIDDAFYRMGKDNISHIGQPRIVILGAYEEDTAGTSFGDCIAIDATRSRKEITKTFLHEYGHYIHWKSKNGWQWRSPNKFCTAGYSTKKTKGFVTTYAQCSQNEDFAETFELMQSDCVAFVHEFDDDEIVMSKAAAVARTFSALTHGRMGRNYWKEECGRDIMQ